MMVSDRLAIYNPKLGTDYVVASSWENASHSQCVRTRYALSIYKYNIYLYIYIDVYIIYIYICRGPFHCFTTSSPIFPFVDLLKVGSQSPISGLPQLDLNR